MAAWSRPDVATPAAAISTPLRYTENRLALEPLSNRNDQLAAIALVLGALLLTYWSVLGSLVGAWYTDDNYSHGFFIVPAGGLFRLGAAREFVCDADPSLGIRLGRGRGQPGPSDRWSARRGAVPVARLDHRVVGGRDPVLVRMEDASRAAVPARILAADDSAAGNHFQPDRISSAVAGIERRGIRRLPRSNIPILREGTC